MDEQEATEYFEKVCGSRAKATELHNLWKNTSDNTNSFQLRQHQESKYDRFVRRAKEQGFTQKQINALMNLQ